MDNQIIQVRRYPKQNKHLVGKFILILAALIIGACIGIYVDMRSIPAVPPQPNIYYIGTP